MSIFNGFINFNCVSTTIPLGSFGDGFWSIDCGTVMEILVGIISGSIFLGAVECFLLGECVVAVGDAYF